MPTTKKTNKRKASNSQEEELLRDLGDASALASLALSDGGKLLIVTLSKEVTSAVDSISSGYKDYTHQELIAVCANLKARIDLLRALTRAESAQKMLHDVWIESFSE